MPIRALTAGRDLLIRFCQILLRPLLALDRFSGSRSPGYLAGSDRSAIPRSILPNLGIISGSKPMAG